jgi:hypothetical protein
VQSNALYDIVGPVRLTIAKTLPNNYTGIAANTRQSGIMETARLTQNFTEVMREYSLRANITMENSGCDKICYSYATVTHTVMLSKTNSTNASTRALDSRPNVPSQNTTMHHKASESTIGPSSKLRPHCTPSTIPLTIRSFGWTRVSNSMLHTKSPRRFSKLRTGVTRLTL